jgi:hypothetical protein
MMMVMIECDLVGDLGGNPGTKMAAASLWAQSLMCRGWAWLLGDFEHSARSNSVAETHPRTHRMTAYKLRPT